MSRTNGTDGIYLSIDAGGSLLRIAAYDPQTIRAGLPQELARVAFTTTRDSNADYQTDMTRLKTGCKELEEQCGRRIAGIGFAVAGKLDPRRQHITLCGNLGHWVFRDIKGMLEEDFECPVVLGNDAEAAAWAEALFGPYGATHEPFMFVVHGTGLGGAVVTFTKDGSPQVAPSEPGHHSIQAQNGRKCGCRKHGCFEAYVGGSALQQYYHKAAAELSSEQWQEVSFWLAAGLANLSLLYPGIPHIVMAGGVIRNQPSLLTNVRRRWGMPGSDTWLDQAPTLELTSLGANIGLLGGLALLLR